MTNLPNRRFALGALLGGLSVGSAMTGTAAAATPIDDTSRSPTSPLAALEARSGGRLGVKAIDTGSGRIIDHRADERFAMCSTHKTVSVAAVLRQVDIGTLSLDRRVPFGRADLLDYAPVARKHVAAGFMTVEMLCEAAVRWSDNTAANLLLRLIDGPGGWTRYARSVGDVASRLDRIEPELNTAVPADPRDTTTPSAMTAMLATILLGTALSEASKARLRGWMYDSEITATLFSAGVPRGWHVADKSGSGENGSRNDTGILYPPASAPILLSIYLTGCPLPSAGRERVVSTATRIVCEALRAG